MKATIFNIQKFCLHDGPGIRTTIFFKGCPLKCIWCANPESQHPHPQILKDKSKCISCLLCHENEFVVSDCPTFSASFSGKKRSVEKVYNEAIKDIEFYKSSGGGVTFSGGEPLLHLDFIKELSKLLRQKDIHLACETSGYASEQNFARLLKRVDLLLFDVKHYDDVKHKTFTGVSNEIILKNLETAILNGKDVIVRIPIIPNFNDSLEDMENFGKLLKSLNIKTVNLLPFHQMGESKYEMIDKEYTMKEYKQLSESDLKEHLEVIGKYVGKASF